MTRIVKKPAERRAEIIQAAQHLFETKGYDKTAMQDVLDYLGIAKGTIYHYFVSKEALLGAVVESIVDTNMALMHVRANQADGNALEKMKALIVTGNIAAAHANVLEGLHRPGNEVMHLRLLAATLMRQAPLYADVIKQGCDEGIFQTRAPLECAEFMLTATQFLTDQGIYPWTVQDLKRRAQALPKLIEQILQAPEGSFSFLAALIQVGE